ncbi:MAG: SDR family NAD(P)-dependent oxidoreductase [Acidimicrobiales bacterium]
MLDAFGRPQSVLVLGGTSDIATALVWRLVGDRCRTVVLAGRDEERLQAAASRLGVAGTSVATVTFDAGRPEDADAVVARCLAAVGGEVDVVVMAVGRLDAPRDDGIDPSDVAAVATVNFAWPAAALASLAARLRAQGHGRIVVLSSVAGVRVRPANFPYGASKRGLDAFSLALADELAGSGVSVHVVRPGFVHSKMTTGRRPAPFAVTPADVAEAVRRGLERDERVVWVPAFLRWVFVAMRLLPPAVWRRLPG